MRGRKWQSNTSFLDLLFILIACVLVMLAFLIFMIDAQKEKAKIDTRAEFVIKLTWDDESNDDVDLWVQDPSGGISYWAAERKSTNLMHLDRDDIGTDYDSAFGAGGEVIQVKYNQEITSIRGFMEGEWVVNVHMYEKRWERPANVQVTIEKLNPSIKLIALVRLEMNTDWEEKTILRMTMDKGGNITGTSTLSKPLATEKLQRTRVIPQIGGDPI